MRLTAALPAAALATTVLALAASPALAATPSGPVEVDRGTVSNARVIGNIPAAGGGTVAIHLGGFSGLARVGDSTTDVWTVTDRGANGDAPSGGATGRSGFAGKSFPIPGFTPEIVRLHRSGTGPTSDVTVAQELPLHLPAGTADPVRTDSRVGDPTSSNVTGLPIPDPNGQEEHAYDGTGSTTDLPYDPYGVDSEGIAVAPDGSFWISEEYAPSVLHVAADGTLLRRYVPVGSQLSYGSAVPVSYVLPRAWNTREPNKGAEGIAITPDGSHVYVALQGPLYTPQSGCTSGTPDTRSNLRVADLGTSTPDSPTLQHEWIYQTDPKAGLTGVGKLFISDLSWDPIANRLLVDERDSKAPQKKIYAVQPASYTLTDAQSQSTGAGCTDGETAAQLSAQGTPALTKTLVADLVSAVHPDGSAATYDIYKLEGIARLSDGSYATMDDNDFQLAGSPGAYSIDTSGDAAPYAPGGKPSQLRVFDTAPNAPADLPEAPYAVGLAVVGLLGGGFVLHRRRSRTA